MRKISRFLLTQAEENSNRIKKEIRKFHSQNLDKQETFSKSDVNSWKLRNDSSGVAGILCPNYFSCSPKYSSAPMPNIIHSAKMSIPSKKRGKECRLDNIWRKPVKGCYCYPELKKLQVRSLELQHRFDPPCHYCKSCSAIALVNTSDKQQVSSPLIGCETLRRVQNIDYTPRSQFLRNVQSKVSLVRNTPMGDGMEMCSKLACHQEQSTEISNRAIDSTDKSSIKSNSTMQEDDEKEGEEYSVCHETDGSKKKLESPRRKQTRSACVTKRTLSSKKSIKGKQNVKATQVDQRDCSCCNKYKSEKIETRNAMLSKSSKNRINPDDQATTQIENDVFSEKELKDLRKFREQNYFDTHGSSHTLLTPKSSGSLEQYLLNERLFAHPAGRIHKRDLVVTIPPCATIQRKRVHYFPRYVVRQEKISSNANNKKRRCQSCPLTGHAIDLGILKAQPPINSLALKYQKRLPG